MAEVESARSVPNRRHTHEFVVPSGGVTTTNFASSVYGGTPTAIDPDDAGAAGTGTTISRSDHQHAIVTGTPASVGTANAEGAGTGFARDTHVHDIANGAIDAAALFAAGVVDTAALGAGAVTAPKTTVNFARVRRAANQATVNNTGIDISFDTQDEDTGGWWAIGTPTQFIVPTDQAGVVNVTCNLVWEASGTGRRVLYIVHNTFTIVASQTNVAIGTDPTRLSASTGPMRVAVADTFSFSVLQQSGGALGIIDRTSATIEWLGV